MEYAPTAITAFFIVSWQRYDAYTTYQNHSHRCFGPDRFLYSRVWFNTPELAPAQIMRRLQRFGIKPDGIIIFLSNEPPFKPAQRLRYRGACSAEAHFGLGTS